jgi:dihydrolipoamide dehydrogenase
MGIHGCDSLSVDLNEMQKFKNNKISQMTGGIEYLFKKNNVMYVKGSAKFSSKDTL